MTDGRVCGFPINLRTRHSNCRAGHLRSEFHFPDALEIDEVALHFDSRQRLPQTFRGSLQFLLVVPGFQTHVAAESVSQSSIGAAVGVQHQDHALRSVQPDGCPNLIEHEFTVAVLLGRCQTLRPAGNLITSEFEIPNRLRYLASPNWNLLSKHQTTAASQ